MGIDTYVLLRVRERAALREALEASAIEDPSNLAPLMRPLSDGSVAIFTCLRFHDPDMPYAIRCWLHSQLATRLPDIHDDARGVFVYPDVCAPRAKTYEGIIAELGRSGQFIDPTPPTEEEQAERERAFEEMLAAVSAQQGAAAAATPPEEPAPEEPPRVRADVIDFAAAAERLRGMLAARSADPAAGGSLAAAGLPGFNEVLSQLTGAEAMLGRALADVMKPDLSDPLGHGHVAVLVPAVVARAVGGRVGVGRFDIDQRIDLRDGSAILITKRIGDDEMPAIELAELLAACEIDRAGLGPLPFFRESLAGAVKDDATFEEARLALGDRARPIALRTMDERMRDDRKDVEAWLREED